MSSETGREETNWGRRVRSSTRKHKYLIEARLTGEQRAQKASLWKTSLSHRAEREAGSLWPSLHTVCLLCCALWWELDDKCSLQWNKSEPTLYCTYLYWIRHHRFNLCKNLLLLTYLFYKINYFIKYILYQKCIMWYVTPWKCMQWVADVPLLKRYKILITVRSWCIFKHVMKCKNLLYLVI